MPQPSRNIRVCMCARCHDGLDDQPTNRSSPACGDDRRSRFYSKSCAGSSDTCAQTAVISDGRRQYHCYTYPRKLLAAFPLNLNVESLTQEAMRNITNIEIWKNGAAGNQHPLEYCFLGIAGCSNNIAVNSQVCRRCLLLQI